MPCYIELQSINFGYTKGKTIFSDFSESIFDDSVTVLIGENGAGKTTLIKLITGIIKPQSGIIRVSGQNISDKPLGEMGTLIGYVFQNPERQLFAMTVIEELTFVSEYKGINKIEAENKALEMLNIFGLENKKDSYPPLLSQGEKKRLALAAVLMEDPPYIIMDEPTAFLDEENKEILFSVIKNLRIKGKGLLAVTHDKNFVRKHADRLIELKKGVIVTDEKLYP